MLAPDKNRVAADVFDFVDDADESPESTDALLLDAWNRHRDGDAFRALVHRYSALVSGVCRRQCRNQQDAEDAFQATFLAFSRDASKVRTASALPGWLYRIAVRSASRARKRSEQQLETLVEDPVDPNDTLDAIAQRHRLRALDEEMSRMPRKYRDVIVLHHLEGYTCQQTAEQLGCSEPSVRGQLQRARRLLRRMLNRRGINLSLTFAALQLTEAAEVVSAEVIEKTIQTAANSDLTSTDTSHLEPLLVKETFLMSSTTTAATVIAVSAFALVGITFAQSGSLSADDAAPNATTIPAAFDDAPTDSRHGQQTSSRLALDPLQQRSPAGSSQWVGGNRKKIEDIELALQNETAVEFIEKPLNEAIEFISEQNDLPIVIDERALEEIGLSSDVAIHLKLQNVSLKSILNLLCRDLDLTYTIDNEVLEITTQEAAEERLLTRVYWSGENGLQLNEGGVNVIETSISPDTWESLGGPSTIAPFGSEKDEATGIVVMATYQVHRKIEALLDAIADGTPTKVSGPKTPYPISVGNIQIAPTKN